jgi:iron-regulated transporter 1
MIMIFRESFVDTLWNGKFLYFCQAIIIIINCVSNAASMANKISIEKDWVIVVAQHAYSDDQDTKIETSLLASMNATVRRFDLLTAILAPLLAGLIMSFLKISPSFNGTVMSAITFAVWNLISFFVEYNLLASVYSDIPELKKKNLKIYNNEQENTETTKRSFKQRTISSVNTIVNGWKIYMTQGLILLPSLVLAILYLTVLSFDSITVGYAKSRKLTETFISILQGLGSLFGILGTIAFPLMHNRFHMSLNSIGLISFTLQIIFLFICLISIFLPGSPFVLANKLFSTNINYCHNTTNLTSNQTLIQSRELSKLDSFFFESPCINYLSIVSLLTAMAISRFGLWLTDLVIHQMIQESVDQDERGVIGGVQNSMNKIFDTLKYFCVILFSEITQYGYLVILSVSAVFISYILYIGYVMCTTIKKRYHKVPQNELKVIQSNEQENEKNEDHTAAIET